MVILLMYEVTHLHKPKLKLPMVKAVHKHLYVMMVHEILVEVKVVLLKAVVEQDENYRVDVLMMFLH